MWQSQTGGLNISFSPRSRDPSVIHPEGAYLPIGPGEGRN